MTFVYEGQTLQIDNSKISYDGYNYNYSDTILCGTDNVYYLQYENVELIINRKKFEPFLNITFPKPEVKVQMLDMDKLIGLKTLKSIDNRLEENNRDFLMLNQLERRFLNLPLGDKLVILPVKNELIIELMNKAIRPYIL